MCPCFDTVSKISVLKFVYICRSRGTSPTTLNDLSGDEDFWGQSPVCRAGSKGEGWGRCPELRATTLTKEEALRPILKVGDSLTL